MVAASHVADRLALALDPVLLAERAGITPDPWQADVLRSEAAQTLILASRQAGKSTITSVAAVHEVTFRAPALVLLLAPSLRQATELHRKVKSVLGALGDVAPTLTQESTLTLEFENGSRVVALPNKEANIRGYSAVSLLIVDEASRVGDDLWTAVRPMLAVSRGRVILISTPWGKRGFFYHEATSGTPDWHRVKITAHEVPRIDPEWLERERMSISPLAYRSEYLCEFVDTTDQVFGYDLVMGALSADVTPLFGPVATQPPPGALVPIAPLRALTGVEDFR